MRRPGGQLGARRSCKRPFDRAYRWQFPPARRLRHGRRICSRSITRHKLPKNRRKVAFAAGTPLIASLGEPTVKETHGQQAVAARSRGGAPLVRRGVDAVVNAERDRFTLNRGWAVHRGAMRSHCGGRLRALGVGGELRPPRCSGGGMRLCSDDNWRSPPWWARSSYPRGAAAVMSSAPPCCGAPPGAIAVPAVPAAPVPVQAGFAPAAPCPNCVGR